MQRWSRWVAALLSVVVPGLGHGYKGEVAAGVVWFVVVMLAYAFLTAFGLVLHASCIVAAASGEAWTEGRTTVLHE